MENLEQHHIEWRQSSWKAIAMKPCIMSEETGCLRACHQKKFLRSCPAECQKTPFCKVGYKLFYSAIFAEKEN